MSPVELQIETSSAAMVDADGDELRVERRPEGYFVTASQEECTATVGPFEQGEIEALLALTGPSGPMPCHRSPQPR